MPRKLALTVNQCMKEVKEETCLVQGCRSELKGLSCSGAGTDCAKERWLETEICFIKKGKPSRNQSGLMSREKRPRERWAMRWRAQEVPIALPLLFVQQGLFSGMLRPLDEAQRRKGIQCFSIAVLSTLHFFMRPQVGEGFIFLCELSSLDVLLDVSASSPFSPATQMLRLQECVNTPISNITSFFYDLIGVLCVCTTETRAHDLAHAKQVASLS